MNLINHIVVLADRVLRLGRRDRAFEQQMAGKCMHHVDDYWCPELAVDGSWCWDHKPPTFEHGTYELDVDEDWRGEWDDEDPPSVVFRDGPRWPR